MEVIGNVIKLEFGTIEINVDDGDGEYRSSVYFYLEFLWVNPDDEFDRVAKEEGYSSLELALDTYDTLDKEVGLRIFKE